MSQGRRVIPESTRYDVVRAMEEGATVRQAAEEAGVDIGTALNYWHRAYGSLKWPAAHDVAAPLRFISTHVSKVVVIDYECPHCGAIIHHPAIDTNRPYYCHWCGKEVA